MAFNATTAEENKSANFWGFISVNPFWQNSP
jgi:hypothetical protein